jgi:hypothetical protein
MPLSAYCEPMTELTRQSSLPLSQPSVVWQRVLLVERWLLILLLVALQVLQVQQQVLQVQVLQVQVQQQVQVLLQVLLVLRRLTN